MLTKSDICEYVLEVSETIRKAKDNFWIFCKLLHGYKDYWWHLKELCNILQSFYENKLINKETDSPYKKLMINLPPRHYKTRTLILFSCWILGKNIDEKIISTAYNDDLATEFSRYTRDEISREKNFDYEVVYSDIFPNTKIKYGDSSHRKWALEGKHFSYKGVGIGGSITGKGCSMAVIDDQIKNYEEACSELALEKIWNWYTGTFLSRLEEGAKQIIVMTRWTDKDICGMIQEDKEESKEWYYHRKEVWTKEEGMLCEDMLSYETYLDKKKIMNENIFYSNYHNVTIQKKGRLYKKFSTYDDFVYQKNGTLCYNRFIGYIDYADEGDNYLCCIFGLEYLKAGYVTEVIYTQEQSEKTEDLIVDAIIRNKTMNIKIESQSGGKAFARNVERKLKEKGIHNVSIEWFHQSKNKLSRIFSNQTNVEKRVLFPKDWAYRWTDFFKAVSTFMKSKKNKYDDAPDGLTGFIEMIDDGQGGVYFDW
jgi:predicted phage terminase large subunit-like protein